MKHFIMIFLIFTLLFSACEEGANTKNTDNSADKSVSDADSANENEESPDTEAEDAGDVDCDKDVYQFSALEMGKSDETSLCDFAGEVIIVVNIAANCGYTSQLNGLSYLYDQYSEQGFTILAFFSNQFAGQMGTPEEQEAVCNTYNVNFSVFSEVNVNSPASGAENQEPEHPLFTWLKSESDSGADIQWNFEKFLISKDGSFIKRYLTQVTPAQLTEDIEKALENGD